MIGQRIMNVLITGVNGFIGSHIAEGLKSDHHIIGCGRHKCRVKGIDYFVWDIGSEERPDALAKIKPDVIIHAAACMDKNDLSSELFMTNCVGTHRIYRLAVERQTKMVIYISSLPIIGKPSGLITEETYPDPLTMYHVTKTTGELIFKQLADRNITNISCRVSSPIGCGMAPDTILPIMLRNASEGRAIKVYGKGTRRQNYIDVRDISSAIEKIINKTEKIRSGIYNLVAEKSYSNLEAAEICSKAAGSRAGIEYTDNIDLFEGWRFDASNKKLLNVIGTYQKYSFEESVRHIYENNFLL